MTLRQVDIIKYNRGLDYRTQQPFQAGIKRYLRAFTMNRTPNETPILLNDWYQRKVTAQEQGAFWFHTLWRP